MARKQERPSAVRAFMARADIGPVLVVAAFPEQRMICQSRHFAQMIKAWLPAEFAEKTGYVVLASEFGSHWRCVFRRNAGQGANDWDQAGGSGVQVRRGSRVGPQ